MVLLLKSYIINGSIIALLKYLGVLIMLYHRVIIILLLYGYYIKDGCISCIKISSFIGLL